MSGGAAPVLRVAIVGVGDELLAGELVDTNSAWLAQLVRAHGHVVCGVSLAGDEIGAVARAVRRAGEDADLVLTTGGLGPTVDDLTRDGVAAAFGLALAERPELVAELAAHAARTGLPLGEGNRRQAVMPKGAEVLPNPRGTAPGILMRVPRPAGATAAGQVLVACLPGVPSEMRGMAEALLAAHVPPGPALRTRKLLACGPPESVLGEQLKDLMHHADAWRGDARLGINVSQGVMSIYIRGNDAAAVARMEAAVRERLGVTVFGAGDDTLPGVVVALLAARGATLTTAESCTGGLLAGALTSVPGSSAVFREGLITYSYEAKTARLGVSRSLLTQHGAVSEVVARAMARGARERAAADFALAISGIAGPDGGTPDKPVGTVVFALSDASGDLSHVRHWKGSRDEIRGRSVTASLEMLRRHLLKGA